MQDSLGLYIHIPFCQMKCNYCSFLTYTFTEQNETIDRYVNALIQEFALHPEQTDPVNTIYIGGGTPSFLTADQMTRIMQAVRTNFDVTDDCEITIEMNPESITPDRVQAYLDQGINRFSMGVQSFNDEVLHIMGRWHTQAMVFDKYQLLKEMGCNNINIDLMFANPHQGMDVLKRDLETALTLDIQHISYYSLMIKKNTKFARWLKAGLISQVDDDLDRDMYHYIQSTLRQHSFDQYEISNFAKPGYASRHNQKYWNLQNYLGLGLGASSNMDLERFTNVSRFNQYFEAIAAGQPPVDPKTVEVMTLDDREKEYIILNLRMLKGFSIEEINHRFGIDFLTKYQDAITKHTQNGIVVLEDGYLRFTDFGLDIGNQFYLDII